MQPDIQCLSQYLAAVQLRDLPENLSQIVSEATALSESSGKFGLLYSRSSALYITFGHLACVRPMCACHIRWHAFRTSRKLGLNSVASKVVSQNCWQSSWPERLSWLKC